MKAYELAAENKGMRREIERLRRALKVIRTWAAYDDETCKMIALTPADVVSLCDKALIGKGSGE